MNEDSYKEYTPSVNIINRTEIPLTVIYLAMDLTMKKNIVMNSKKSEHLLKQLLEMNHTSIFEHVNYTFLISDVSRNFMAQITRHRMGSFTCSSQHYQHYEDYPFVIDKKWKDNPFVRQAVECSKECYMLLKKAGCPKEEVR